MKANEINLMKLWSWSEKTMGKMKTNGYGVLNMRNCVSMYAGNGLGGGHQSKPLNLKISGKETPVQGVKSPVSGRSEPEPTAFPLRMAGEGEKVKIFSLNGGKNFHDRLAGLGMHIGEQVEIIQNRKGGKLLLGLGNTRFFLGEGMSWKIQVTAVADEKQIKEDNK